MQAAYPGFPRSPDLSVDSLDQELGLLLLIAQLQQRRQRQPAPWRRLSTVGACMVPNVLRQVDSQCWNHWWCHHRGFGRTSTQAIAVQACRIHMEPLMQPYANVKNEVHNFEFNGLCICLLSRALVAV